jgi:hypothetical protein
VLIRLFFLVAFLQVFSLQNSFAFDDDKENLSPPLSPYSKLDRDLSPVRNALALQLVDNGSVSPDSIEKTYKQYAPELIAEPLFYDPLLFDLEISLSKMQEGKSGTSYKEERMDLHHVYQTDDGPLAYLPKSIHYSTDRYIVVNKIKKSIVRTRLTRDEAFDLVEADEENVVVGNTLHPYKGSSLINRPKFNNKRRATAKQVAQKLKEINS